MKYYVVAIEQTHDANNNIVEYAKATQYDTEKTAMSAFYDKLAAVNKDLNPDTAHTWMDIKIVNSQGGYIKKDQIGQYVESEA